MLTVKHLGLPIALLLKCQRFVLHGHRASKKSLAPCFDNLGWTDMSELLMACRNNLWEGIVYQILVSVSHFLNEQVPSLKQRTA